MHYYRLLNQLKLNVENASLCEKARSFFKTKPITFYKGDAVLLEESFNGIPTLSVSVTNGKDESVFFVFTEGLDPSIIVPNSVAGVGQYTTIEFEPHREVIQGLFREKVDAHDID